MSIEERSALVALLHVYEDKRERALERSVVPIEDIRMSSPQGLEVAGPYIRGFKNLVAHYEMMTVVIDNILDESPALTFKCRAVLFLQFSEVQ